MRSRLRSVFYFLLFYSGLEYLIAKLAPANACAILMYHGICEDAPMPPEVNFHLGKEDFERQVDALARRYDIRPLHAVAKDIGERSLRAKSVVVTFDDGYRNNLVAAEVLKRRRLPWTVYVVTDHIGAGWMSLNKLYSAWSSGKISESDTRELRKTLRSTPAKLRPTVTARIPESPVSAKSSESFDMMDWKDVAALSNAAVEIGAHTRTHCNLAIEAEADAAEEILGSKQAIEQRIGKTTTSFAYPYGSFSKSTRALVVGQGFTNAVSTDYGLADSASDLFALPRIGLQRRTWYLCSELAIQFLRHSLGGSAVPSASQVVEPRSNRAHG